jgi:hypothetical protein
MKSFKQYILDEETAFIEKPVDSIIPQPTKGKKKAIKPPVEEPLEPIDVDPS